MVPAGGPVRYVLEVIGGTARKLGIEPGDKVTRSRSAEPRLANFDKPQPAAFGYCVNLPQILGGITLPPANRAGSLETNLCR